MDVGMGRDELQCVACAWKERSAYLSATCDISLVSSF